MRHPQLLVVEADGRLAGVLRELARSRRWAVREPRHPDGCHRLLRRGGPGVLVLRTGRDLLAELALVEEVDRHFPEIVKVVVTDTDDPALLGLIWDLGAGAVLSPPWTPADLAELVAGLMGATG
jgi:hypothetical protein